MISHNTKAKILTIALKLRDAGASLICLFVGHKWYQFPKYAYYLDDTPTPGWFCERCGKEE